MDIPEIPPPDVCYDRLRFHQCPLCGQFLIPRLRSSDHVCPRCEFTFTEHAIAELVARGDPNAAQKLLDHFIESNCGVPNMRAKAIELAKMFNLCVEVRWSCQPTKADGSNRMWGPSFIVEANLADFRRLTEPLLGMVRAANFAACEIAVRERAFDGEVIWRREDDGALGHLYFRRALTEVERAALHAWPVERSVRVLYDEVGPSAVEEAPGVEPLHKPYCTATLIVDDQYEA